MKRAFLQQILAQACIIVCALTYVIKNKSPRVSIVLPVYNEADQIAATLWAIARQSVRPHEVIVVDNNSTDGTAAIAGTFPFVKVLKETRQGVVHARNRGFDAATGDIIGRIDADTVIPSDWVQTVRLLFRDDDLDAVSGRITYHDMAQAELLNRVDLFFRRRFARLLGREVALQGANMAIRRDAWLQARQYVCGYGGLHEDFDLAIHLNWLDCKVGFDEHLVASIGFRQTEQPWREFARYALLSPRTYAKHGLKSQRHMYPVVLLAVCAYLPLRLLHRGYDAASGTFSWRAAFAAPAAARVNPATYVD